MKVLHIIGSLDQGGAETVLYNLIKQGRRDASVVSLTTEGVLGSRLRDVGVEVHTLDLKLDYLLIAKIIRLIRIIRLNGPDVVQTWLYHADFLGSICSYLAGVRSVVWSVHTTSVNHGVSRPTRLLRLLCAPLSWAIPKKIIYVARAAQEAHEKLGYRKGLGQVVPNGFDVPPIICRRLQLRQSLGVDDQTMVIGSVGRFNPDKDIRTMLRAVQILKNNSNHKIKLVFAGTGLDYYNQKLCRWIDEMCLGEAVCLVGRQEEIGSYYEAMDVFCLHSKTEAFPLVLGEAMSYARPCITTDVGDARFLLSNCGVVVPPGSPDQLSSALDHILSMAPAERAMLGKRARARIIEHFSMSKMSESYEAVYVSMNQKMGLV